MKGAFIIDFSHGRAHVTEPPEKLRRAKTGCITCRRRRKKCDETKPRCTACSRNRLLCAWPDDHAHDRNASFEPGEVASISDGESSSTTLPTTSFSRPWPGDHIPKHQDHGLPAASTTAVPQAPPADTIPPRSFTIAPSPWAVLQADATSGHLFQHFVESTVKRIVATSALQMPFTSHILPVAYNDDNVLHAILAVSGSHLSFRQKSCAFSARSHYAVALRAAKHEVTRFASGSHDRILQLLILLIMLCHFEVCVDSRIRSSRRD